MFDLQGPFERSLHVLNHVMGGQLIVALSAHDLLHVTVRNKNVNPEHSTATKWRLMEQQNGVLLHIVVVVVLK